MRLLLIFFLLLAPHAALAIVNAEDLDLIIEEDGFTGKAGISVSGSSGNTDKINGEGSLRLLWKYGDHTNMLMGSHVYGKSRGSRDTNKSFVHLRHRYTLDRIWAVEAFAQAQQNEFAQLKLRTLYGGGLRYSREISNHSIHLGLGSFYEQEKLRAVANTPETRLWRGNIYFAWRFAANERIRLQNTVYYQPAWKDTADFRVLDNATISIALTKQLDLKLSLEVAHDSLPPAGIRQTDISYKTGLELRF
jgi:putative salt-induced outer membrane protein YdiY